jgi:hypothetical protein
MSNKSVTFGCVPLVFLLLCLSGVKFAVPMVSAVTVDLVVFRTDINHDGIVNILDLSAVGAALGSISGSSGWDSKLDLNADGVINILDMVLAVKDYGMTWQYYDFDEVLDWDVVSGTWDELNGSLEGVSKSEGLIYTRDTVWKDFTLTGKVKVAADSQRTEAAFCFHMVDSGNFYWAGLGCWGHRVSISRMVNGVPQELIFSGDRADVAQGVWYTISIQASGNVIRLYIDNSLELECTESTLAEGSVGIRCWDSHVVIEDLVVKGMHVDQSIDSFNIRGADVPLDAFMPGARNYQPNAWQLLKDLNINLIRCFPGDYEDALHFSVVYDANWAQNLDNFLAKAASNGIKVMFYQMGSIWVPSDLLGIVPYPSTNPRLGQPYDPWNGQTQVGTPIADAKVIIDKLAGNNALGHNFITDPRMYGWSTSNEQDLTDAAALDWNIQLLDYIRGKGGKAWVAHPLFGQDNWDSVTQVRILGDHVDMIELHHYGEYEYINYFARNTQSYGTWNSLYDHMKYAFQQMLNSSFPAEKVFVGEFGCWLGYGTNEGLTQGVTFTAQDRINLYTDVLNAARDVGIKNICFHGLFSETGETPNYGIIKDPASGQGYWDDNLASTIRTAYNS